MLPCTVRSAVWRQAGDGVAALLQIERHDGWLPHAGATGSLPPAARSCGLPLLLVVRMAGCPLVPAAASALRCRASM